MIVSLLPSQSFGIWQSSVLTGQQLMATWLLRMQTGFATQLNSNDLYLLEHRYGFKLA